MTVYGELLFAENFITGWLILLLTGKLRGLRPDRWRIAAGAVMCGIYAFVLFVPMNWFASLASKLIFSSVAVVVAFGSNTVWGVLKNACVFYGVSFLMGGTTIAIMYILKVPGMTGNGSFVVKGVTFVQIAAGVAVTWLLGKALADVCREKLHRRNMFCMVEVEIAGRKWDFTGFVDTGNSLRDPVTGKAVAVLSETAAEKITEGMDAGALDRMLIIPYCTVGNRSLMQGIRPDKIYIDGRPVTDMVLGFGNRDFAPWNGSEKYDVLLHQQYLAGEDITYG